MTMEERIESLERRTARLRLLAVLVTIGASVMAVGFMAACQSSAQAASVAQTIYAKRFVVMDEQGRERGVLTVGRMGPELKLYDQNGKVRIGLGAAAVTAGLSLCDQNAQIRADLRVDKKNGGKLVVRDVQGGVLWKTP